MEGVRHGPVTPASGSCTAPVMAITGRTDWIVSRTPGDGRTQTKAEEAENSSFSLILLPPRENCDAPADH